MLSATSLKELAEVNSKDYLRWQNIKRGRARISADEVELLGQAYPQYRWWLMTGEVMPDKGQVSPEYDKANRNFPIRTRDSDYNTSNQALVCRNKSEGSLNG